MTPEQLANVFGGTVVANEDKQVDFAVPIKGKYLAKVTAFERQITEKMDAVKLKMQIFKDIDGDESFSRFMDKTYWLTDGKLSTAQDNITKLGNDLFTMGIFDDQEVPDAPMTKDNIDDLLALTVVGKEVKLSCWAYNKKDGVSKGQSVKIVVNDNEESW